jgi:hypothetical protein
MIILIGLNTSIKYLREPFREGRKLLKKYYIRFETGSAKNKDKNNY